MLDWNLYEKRLVELVTAPEHFSEQSIADILTEEFDTKFTRNAVHNKVRRLDLNTLVSKPITDIMPYYTRYRDIIEDKIETPEKSFVLQFSHKLRLPLDICRILYLGDLHIPFQMDDQIQTAVNRNLRADVVITAEISDLYSLSRFNKTKSVPLEIEIDNILRYLEYLNERFPKVIVIHGNHDKRVTRAMTNVPPVLYFLIESNMLKVLSKPFPNVQVVNNWYFQVNDAVFNHGETFSKLDLKTATNMYTFLREREEELDLDPFSVVVQGHSHSLGTTYRGSRHKLIEGGCLTAVPQYAIDKMYPKPQANGYVVVVQQRGKSDFNLTREYVFESKGYIPQESALYGAGQDA